MNLVMMEMTMNRVKWMRKEKKVKSPEISFGSIDISIDLHI